MVTLVISACAGLIAALLAALILPYFLKTPEGGETPPAKWEKFLPWSGYLLLPVFFGWAGYVQRDLFGPLDFAAAGILIFFLYLFAVIDLKRKVVPNLLLLCMGGTYILLAVAALILDLSDGLYRLFVGVIGAAVVGLIFLLAYLISRRQLGGGDVKLVALMGLFMTSERIIGGVFYGLLLCSVYSIVMMLFKKLTRKDAVPLVPFLFLGTFISYLVRLS